MTHNAYLIDARERRISETTAKDFRDILRLLEAKAFTIGLVLPDNSVLYVDDEGYLKPQKFYFAMKARQPAYPFAGHGVLMGPEIEDSIGYHIGKPALNLQQVRAEVTFPTRAEVEQWVQGKVAGSTRNETGQILSTLQWDTLLASSQPR